MKIPTGVRKVVPLTRHTTVCQSNGPSSSSSRPPSKQAQARRMQRLRQSGKKSNIRRENFEDTLKEQQRLEEQMEKGLMERQKSATEETEGLTKMQEDGMKDDTIGFQIDSRKESVEADSESASVLTPVTQDFPKYVEAEIADENRHISLEDEAKSLIQRKAGILIEFMQSGGDIEAAIARNVDEIDEMMLELLERRIDAAQKLEQKAEVVSGLEMLYRRLKNEIDRRSSTASLRLLDSLLLLYEEMNDGDENLVSQNERESFRSQFRIPMVPASRIPEIRKRVRAELQAAFFATKPKADLIAIASQLAENQQEAAATLLDGHVDAQDFIQEVTVLMNSAKQQQLQLYEALESLGDSNPERQRIELIKQQREITLSQVEDILELARQVAPTKL